MAQRFEQTTPVETPNGPGAGANVGHMYEPGARGANHPPSDIAKAGQNLKPADVERDGSINFPHDKDGHKPTEHLAEKGSGTQPGQGDLLPSGKQQERREDGFPIGGRPNYTDGWLQNHQEANQWKTLQSNNELTPHEKFAAGRMALQLDRRGYDPIREDLAMHGTADEKVDRAKNTLKEWGEDFKTLQGKLSPEQTALATKVHDELHTELAQEEWRKQKGL